MRSAKSLAFAAVVVVTVVAACTDRRPDTPTGPGAIRNSVAYVTMGTCTTPTQLNALAAAVFGSGSPNVNSVLGKLDNLYKQVAAGDTADAQAQAQNIVSFVQQKATQGTLPGSQADITAFISGVLCYAGLSPDTFLILPSDSTQVRIASNGQSGVSLQANTVDVPTLLTINTLDPSGPSPLVTKLDQYPTYIDIQFSSTLLKPAVVALCPTAAVPADVRPHLHLGHQASGGFELPPPADASFLPCSVSTSQSRISGILHTVASLVMPAPLYAAAFGTGGVGGSITEFSPFGAVDTDLSYTGGVGGSLTEFSRKPATPIGITPVEPKGKPRFNVAPNSGASTTAATGQTTIVTGGPAFTVVDGVCTASAATVGTQLEPECRPTVLVKTHNGTVMAGVPVVWAVTSGGGTIAPETVATKACGDFDATAHTTTDAFGLAGICWLLGPNGGENTVTATPSFGGDAPEGVTFSPATQTFTATSLKITPTATATGGSFVFDNTPKTGSGACSNSLTPDLTYSSGTAPVNVGDYTLTVTCGANSTVYNTVSTTATISITPATPVVTVSCPDTAVYTGSALTPCTATVTGPALSETPAPTYSNNVSVGTATATVSRAAGGNYAAASGSGTFRIVPAYTLVSVSCPSGVTYDGSVHAVCTAAASGPDFSGLSVGVTYSATPVNAGSYVATGTYAGGGNYRGSTGTATLSIGKLAATATSGDATINFGNAVPVIPCTVGGLLSADAGSVTCVTTVPPITVAGTYATTPVWTPANPTNYAMTGVPGTLTVLPYVQQGCFESPIYSVMPSTKSAQRKGSTLPVKCTLTDTQGNPVTTATGDITITDVGMQAVTPPVKTGTVVFTGTNVFKFSRGGNYSYGYDTSNLTSGHYYYVTARWNDGSITEGWFLIK